MGWEEERKEGERVINKTSVTQRIKIISIKTYLISVRNELNATFKCTCQTVATLHTQTFINMQRIRLRSCMTPWIQDEGIYLYLKQVMKNVYQSTT